MRKVGDLFMLEATGQFAPGIEMIVAEMKDGQISKAKAAIPDPRLGRYGFIEENGDYYVTVWDICRN